MKIFSQDVQQPRVLQSHLYGIEMNFTIGREQEVRALQSHLYGIEIVQGFSLFLDHYYSNRTFMELKCYSQRNARLRLFNSNRTFMELKYFYILLKSCLYPKLQSHLYGIEIKEQYLKLPNSRNSNRTFMELKYDITPLIPYWCLQLQSHLYGIEILRF